jgi:hypothetical protein
MSASKSLYAVGVIFTLILLPGVARAQELPSHLGVQPDAFVTLEYHNTFANFVGCTTVCGSPNRILPDGSRVAFTIPSGAVLVITDVQWRADGSGEGDSAQIWSASVGYMSLARFDSREVAMYSEHLTSGIVVSKIPAFAFAHHLDSHLVFLFVRGYLAYPTRIVK